MTFKKGSFPIELQNKEAIQIVTHHWKQLHQLH